MGLRVSDESELWPDGLIPFEIDETDFPSGSADEQEILDAIAMVNANTHVTFTPRSGDITYVVFRAATESCSTNTGMAAGENAISCDISTFAVGNIVHEMCHELGLHHEQIREDRDGFVTVQWGKIESGKCHNFKRKVTPQPANYSDCVDTYDPATQNLITTDVGEYDYDSIMHYGKTFFRKDGETGDTLTPTDPTASIGQRTALSDGDIDTLNQMYGTAAIYVRDNLTDDGEEPLSGGGLSLSPDIIHVPVEESDPQSSYGTPAAIAIDDFSEDVEFGQTNYVYVRLQKNGTLIDSADVDLYWTSPSTLPTPASWTKIGDTISEADIAPGDVRVVGPFLFNDVPAQGHYCFVAIVNSRKNPAPDLSSINTATDFINLVRSKSNVAWKNFDVVDVESDGQADMDFYVETMKFASDDNELEFDFRELPSGIETEVRILKRLVETANLENLATDRELAYHRILKGTGSSRFYRITQIPMESRDSTVVRLTIRFSANIPDGSYDISVRQLKSGMEMGRITRRLNIGAFPFIANSRSGELHRSNCPWVAKMSPVNKVPFATMEKGLGRGYDGCHTCLPEHDHG